MTTKYLSGIDCCRLGSPPDCRLVLERGGGEEREDRRGRCVYSVFSDVMYYDKAYIMDGCLITSHNTIQLTIGGRLLRSHSNPAGLQLMLTPMCVERYVPSPNADV